MPANRLHIIQRDVAALGIHDPEAVLRPGVSLVGGQADGLDVTLRLCLILTWAPFGAFRSRIRRPTQAKAGE